MNKISDKSLNKLFKKYESLKEFLDEEVTQNEFDKTIKFQDNEEFSFNEAEALEVPGMPY